MQAGGGSCGSNEGTTWHTGVSHILSTLVNMVWGRDLVCALHTPFGKCSTALCLAQKALGGWAGQQHLVCYSLSAPLRARLLTPNITALGACPIVKAACWHWLYMAWQYGWLGAAHQQDSRGAGVLDAGVSV